MGCPFNITVYSYDLAIRKHINLLIIIGITILQLSHKFTIENPGCIGLLVLISNY